MSRYIKSAETLKARAGKQVKVDGDLCNVTEKGKYIGIESVDGRYHATVMDIEGYLRDHNVATAGYKFKQTSKAIEGFILDQECRVTLKPYIGTFDDHSSCHTVVGMLRFCKDHCGDKGYMLLTNDEHLCGDPAEDMKGYDWSWWLGFDEKDLKERVEKTEPLESECNAVTQSGTEKTECNCVTQSGTEEKEYSLLQFMGDEDSRKTVKGVIKELNGISYLLSNDDTFDGGHPDATEGTDYKYGWWLCEGSDISKSGYAIREACAESDTHSYRTSDDFIIEKECLVTIKPEEGRWEGEVHTVTGMLVKSYGDWYLLSNEKNLDGTNPHDMRGYEYGWYVSDKDLKDQDVVLKTELLSSVVSESATEDTFVRIAKALERIAVALEK